MAKIKIEAALKFAGKRGLTIGNNRTQKKGKTFKDDWKGVNNEAKRANRAKREYSQKNQGVLEKKLALQGGKMTKKIVKKVNLPYKKGDVSALYKLYETRTAKGKEHVILPTNHALSKYGKAALLKEIVIGKMKAYEVLPLSKQIENILKKENKGKVDRTFERLNYNKLPRVANNTLYALRLRISAKVERAIRDGMMQAQEDALKALNDAKNWNNLTGNAYTGLVSMVYLRLKGKDIRRTKSVAQATSGKKTMATRSMISPGRYGTRRTDGNSLQLTKKGVFHGRRYDNPNSWFSISDRGQFVPTSGKYAYTEAKEILNASSYKLPTSRGSYAAMRLASGAPYIHIISPEFMDNAASIMRVMVAKYIGQYLKAMNQ